MTAYTNLQVWHIPQVPGKAFRVPVESPEDAARIMAILAAYDQFQLDQGVKDDYSNAQGLDCLNGGEREDWYGDDGEGFEADFDELYDKLQARFYLECMAVSEDPNAAQPPQEHGTSSSSASAQPFVQDDKLITDGQKAGSTVEKGGEE